MPNFQILLFSIVGNLIIIASTFLMSRYPTRIHEVAGGMFLGLLLLWSIPLAFIACKRKPTPPRMGERLSAYAGLREHP